MQTRWASIINPVIACPMAQVLILKDIELITGANSINHLLGRVQQGWFIVDIDGTATIYRSAPFNDRSLNLTSSAGVTISLGVF